MSRDDGPGRLRSSRSQQISAARDTARQRRASIDAEFRAALLAELGPNVSATVAASPGGVTGSAGVTTATILTGHGKNVSLDSGSQMSLAVALR